MNFNQDLLEHKHTTGKSCLNSKTFAMPFQSSIQLDQLKNMTAITEMILRTLNAPLLGTTKAGFPASSEHDATYEKVVHDTNSGGDKSNAGHFISDSYVNAHGKRDYKFYIPSDYKGEALPLIVMLHGCTQGPDDFATGTGMNLIAEQHRCIVVYPCQDQGANSSKCWNWFKAIDQKRDQGEPALIAGITRKIMADYHIDKRSVFIAGMSAGGAMAAIMADAYPELYAAVGIHSGLPFGAASDLSSVLAAMHGAASQIKKPFSGVAVPIIVFHGDQDHTVNSKNADHLMERYLDSSESKNLVIQKENGTGKLDRRYTRIRYAENTASQKNSNKSCPAEQWVIHGAGHAWSGGNGQGSFTDAAGPDASREMLRFFLSQVSHEQTYSK
ncbi:alpha/beta hydrolase family esterase [Undibacterium sp. Di27W]|uniref:extracellular catalytic domain type 1 short-chain-length polyhydroxyalkanoate depolymerase n=1 Tax=Undibacterium sp. Di27W TaxID=3413036 RepID=UPI003BF01DB5